LALAAIAMRCLDEGVDIPSVQTAIIMASTSNPRQFIRRRDRVLRRAPGKDRAHIIDFVVCPPADAEIDADARSLLRGEMRRINEFAMLADNTGVVQGR
jgi:superfamily II DNA or RNA helicase